MAFTSRKRTGAVANKKNKNDGKPTRRGGRSLSRKNSAEDYDTDDSSGGPAVVDPNAPLRRRTPMDLTLLARGMSARAVGSRLAGKIKILSEEDIDKDLRHMEAYDVACTTYSQQFFAYTNQELVARGVYGPVPPLPGSPGYPGAGFNKQGGYDPVTGQYHHPAQGSPSGARYQRMADGRMVPVGSPSSAAVPSQGGGAPFAMPVTIDPEEEKRLAQLKKKIAIAETRRETLEGEYESLKSHFWWASKVLERTKHSVTGQMELLQDMVQKRGRVVALRRVQFAVSKDILACLEARDKGVAIGKSKAEAETNGGDAMEGVEVTKDGENENEKVPEMKDLIDCWNWIDSQLEEAEKACNEASSPVNLIALKKILAAQRKGRPADSASDANDGGKSNQKDKKKDKRGSSDEGSGASNAKDIDAAVYADEDGILPWMSQMMPRTPHGVPVYYSYLSAAPDRAGAFGTGGAFGADPNSLAWLEANLPQNFEPAYTKDREELDRLREEVEYLAEELELERDNNKELQSEIISNRKRSDEMISMMSIIRTETEAVLNRHNMILDTKEARAKAEVLHKEHLLAVEREEALARQEESEAQATNASGDVADGDADSPSAGAAEMASMLGDDDAGDVTANGDDSSNKRSLEAADSDSPSRSNGGLNKRRRRM